MSMFFLYDELTDHECEKGASKIAGIIMDALVNPQKARPPHESIMGEIVRQYVIIFSSCSPLSIQL